MAIVGLSCFAFDCVNGIPQSDTSEAATSPEWKGIGASERPPRRLPEVPGMFAVSVVIWAQATISDALEGLLLIEAFSDQAEDRHFRSDHSIRCLPCWAKPYLYVKFHRACGTHYNIVLFMNRSL